MTTVPGSASYHPLGQRGSWFHTNYLVNLNRAVKRVDGVRFVEARVGPTRLVREVVKRLLRKLGNEAAEPRHIITEPRIGYRMAAGEGAGTGWSVTNSLKAGLSE